MVNYFRSRLHPRPRPRYRPHPRPQPQPQPQPHNQIRVLWTDEQCEYLLDQRMYRNVEFWNLSHNNRNEFWSSIAEKINDCFGTNFDWRQVKTKWKNLLQDYLVSLCLNIRNMSIFLTCIALYILMFNVFRIKFRID